MKLYLATLTTLRNGGETNKLCILFAHAFGRFVGLRMSNSGHLLIGTTQVPESRHWDSMPSWFETPHTLEDLRDKLHNYGNTSLMGTLINVDVREVTGDEHKWFNTVGLGTYIVRIINDISYNFVYHDYDKRGRLQRLATSMQTRADSYNNSRRNLAEYKGRRYHESSFLPARNFCKMVGQLVREAILANDSGRFEEVFMDNYDMHDSLHNTVFGSVSTALHDNGLSLNVEELYCGHVGERDNSNRARSGGRMRYFCQDCMENDDVIVFAHDADEYMARDEAYYDDYNDQWLSCAPDDDSYDSDDNERNADRLMSYSTNALDHLEMDSSFTSAPFGNFLMGVELEIVTRDSVNAAVADVRDQLGEDYCICKNDGSLPDGGLEIVTAPRALDEHISKFSNWVISSDYNAWKNGRCGMHVHIDSRAFTSLTLGKFIMFMNAEGNAEFLRKIAGRHPLMDSQARSYCRTETQSELVNPSKALKGKSSDRYTIVNTTCLQRNEASRLGVPYVGERKFNTVELRIFRASLKKERLLAQLEFTHASIMFCRVASMRDLNGVSFLKWLKTTDNRYPHLADWYGVRRRPTAKGAEPAEVKCEDAVPHAVPTEERHDVPYPRVLNCNDDAINFIDRYHLHAVYGAVEDAQVMAQVMYFPYHCDDNRIDTYDVVYVLDRDVAVWRLQPVGHLANTYLTDTTTN